MRMAAGIDPLTMQQWPGIWRHGDWLQIETDGSGTITGRSDATINRHGLRMGTADIYSAVRTYAWGRSTAWSSISRMVRGTASC